MKDKLLFPIVGIVCAALLMLPAVLLGYNLGERSGAGAAPQAQAQPAALDGMEPAPAETAAASTRAAPQESTGAEAATGSITIPGFDRVRLAASPEQQSAPFYNPKGNQCYFVISLFLPSGEEIYRSGMIAPGTAAGTVALSYIPPAGIYESAVLRYNCYSLESYEIMNGADVDIILEII